MSARKKQGRISGAINRKMMMFAFSVLLWTPAVEALVDLAVRE